MGSPVADLNASGLAKLQEMLPTREFEAAAIRRYIRLVIAESENIHEFKVGSTFSVASS